MPSGQWRWGEAVAGGKSVFIALWEAQKKSGWEVCFALTSQPLCVVSREDYASTRWMTYVALHNLGSLEAIGRWNAFQENMTIAFKAWCALIATVGRYVKSLFQHFCAFNVISKSAAKLHRIFWIAKFLAWYFSAAISLYTLCIKKFVTANRRQSYNPWPQPFCVARKNSRDVYKFCSIFDSSTSLLFRLPQNHKCAKDTKNSCRRCDYVQLKMFP